MLRVGIQNPTKWGIYIYIYGNYLNLDSRQAKNWKIYQVQYPDQVQLAIIKQYLPTAVPDNLGVLAPATTLNIQIGPH